MFTCVEKKCGFKTVNEEIFRTHMTEHQKLASAEIEPNSASIRVRHPRSDGESSSSTCSSSLSPATPPLLCSSGPESPVMQLARGILGSSSSVSSSSASCSPQVKQEPSSVV